ncbi:uncharacterized protein LOC122253157 [Penaeus japonicus]|uniref:uncharacterized protein LOC122253157 n=1 Tax=Penaeus japonicus TaxID=27405 RepID=UPI001C711954|nr:uncharacterized protein LOC122253157 [Penaeus japonicus]
MMLSVGFVLLLSTVAGDKIMADSGRSGSFAVTGDSSSAGVEVQRTKVIAHDRDFMMPRLVPTVTKQMDTNAAPESTGASMNNKHNARTSQEKNMWPKFQNHKEQTEVIRNIPSPFRAFIGVGNTTHYAHRRSDVATDIPSDVQRKINRASTSMTRPRKRPDRRNKTGREGRRPGVSAGEGFEKAGEQRTREGHELRADIPSSKVIAEDGRGIRDQFSVGEGKNTQENRRRRKENIRGRLKSKHKENERMSKNGEEHRPGESIIRRLKESPEEINGKNLEGESGGMKPRSRKSFDNHTVGRKETGSPEDNVVPKAIIKSETKRRWRGNVSKSKVEDDPSANEADVVFIGTGLKTANEKFHVHFEEVERSKKVYETYGTKEWKEVKSMRDNENEEEKKRKTGYLEERNNTLSEVWISTNRPEIKTTIVSSLEQNTASPLLKSTPAQEIYFLPDPDSDDDSAPVPDVVESEIGVLPSPNRVVSSTYSSAMPNPRLYTAKAAETPSVVMTSNALSLFPLGNDGLSATQETAFEQDEMVGEQSATADARIRVNTSLSENSRLRTSVGAPTSTGREEAETGKITKIDVFHHRHYHDFVPTKIPSTLITKLQRVTSRTAFTSKDFQTEIAEIAQEGLGAVESRNQEEKEQLKKIFDGKDNDYVEGGNHSSDGDAEDDSLRGTPLSNASSGEGMRTQSTVPLLDTEGTVRIPCYVVIFLLGVVGNSLVIVTLLQNRKMRTITNVFLLNLAISDLLLGVFCMPVTLVGSLLRDFIFGAVMCRLIPYFQAVSISVSVWTLVAISLERYYAICQPLRSRGWQTLSHAYKIISIVWFLSLVAMAPIAALSKLLPIGSTNRHKCREMWPSLHLERGFTMFLGLGLLLVPLMIMVAAYFSITVSLWHGMRLERETGQGTNSSTASIQHSHPAGPHAPSPTPTVISLTDLNGLAMVQQSLRRKQSRRHVSKISIRFRKIPSADNRTCEHCGNPKAYTPEPSTSHHDSVPTVNTTHSEASPTLGHDPQYCYHDLGESGQYQQSRWHIESVSENDRYHRRSHKKKKKQHDFKRLRSTHLEKSIEAKKHVIRMLFVVVLEFFLCWTPIFVVNILCLYIPEQVYRALGSFGISFLHLLSYASSCCNPITYCFMNKKFLQGFRYAFGCRKDTERQTRQNGTGASFRSQSNNALRFVVVEPKREVKETTV